MNARNMMRIFACAAVAAAITQNANALTDLADAPLVTSSTTAVHPNVFLMMDDSGSMDWDYMPDWNGNPVFSTSKYGYASAQCNGVFYDPSITYTPPVKADGTSYPDSSFTSAWMDGFNTGLGSVDLSTTFRLGRYQSYGVPSSGSAAYYYLYSGTQTTASQKKYYDSSSTFYQECNTTAASAPTATITVSGSGTSTKLTGITVNGVQIMSGASTASTSTSTVASNIASKINVAGSGYTATSYYGTVTITGPASAAGFTPVLSKSGGLTINTTSFPPFAKITVSSTSGPGGTDERTNFANWFSYYRTRLNMMKSGTGLAFNSIDSSYRIGFGTMNNNGGSKFLNLASFDSAQKTSWYNMLYSVSASNSTPLLKALSRVGLMYADKISSVNGVSVTDPMEYSCQQNFVILSTDGFWNDDTNYDLSGNPVGEQDGATDAPYNDGGSSIVTKKTPTSTVVRTSTETPKTTTYTYTEYLATTASTKGTGGCSSNKYLTTYPQQTATRTISTDNVKVEDTTTTSTETVVITNGTQTSDTTSTSQSTSTVSNNSTTLSDTGVPDDSSTWASDGYWRSSRCSNNPSPSSGNTTVSGGPSITSSSTVNGTSTTTTISTTGPTVGATTTTTSTSGGTSDTLADVAMYYYTTDLRDSSLGNCTGSLGQDVCQNNVPTTTIDHNEQQHMTTFTLGLGAPGRMTFSSTYLTDTSGDYYNILTKQTASSSVCTWQSSGTTCVWPIPDVNGTPENIDDLWHAAVNGRGTYFSATNPTTLSTGLSSALASVAARKGAAAAATTSNPNVTSGDNFVFSSTFTTSEWDGELVRQQLDVSTGALSSTNDWTAQSQLDTNTSRTIYTYSSSSANKLKLFTWTNLTSSEQAYFQTPNISTLSQFCSSGTTCLSAASQTAASGANLVSYLAGDRTNEGGSADTTKYYRQRLHILGDIIDAEAVYVKTPLQSYADAGYSAYVTAESSRQGMVYAAANDGMLHAFNADTGAEVWAYIPSFVLPNLYRLADKNYSSNHKYFADGTPIVGDAYINGAWRTILVAGLNAGGKGYYALDITDPSSPVVLWEFTDTNMGYTFGNPVITKLQDGTWVVLVTSGYNNADGKGYLYVLKAVDGSVVRTITTNTGTAASPSGLAKISGWVDNPSTDNTALRAYGGDLFGNLWRFDINNGGATLLATLKDSGGNGQPITSKPELGTVSSYAVVFVGTGRYLGTTDLSDTSQQSFYAIKDTLDATGVGNPRAVSGFVQQTETTTTCPTGTPSTICSVGEGVRTSSNNAVNFATDKGWYIDLPDTGERVDTDPTLGLGTIAFTSNVPNSNACNTGGYGYRYFLDYKTGAPVSTAGTVVAVKLGNALGTRPVLVRLPNNTVIELTRLSDGTTLSSNVPIGGGTTTARRVSWRELPTDK